MAIRAVVFDIGGILEVWPGEGDPTAAFPQMYTRWEERLGHAPGALSALVLAMDARLTSQGKDGSIGTCTEEEWLVELARTTGWDHAQLDAFMRDFWDTYCGALNEELAAYFQSLRPRYQTALLSNSFVGARREEEARFHFAAMTDLIIYSHEEGMAKPDPRLFALTCERLGARPAEIIFLDDAPGHVGVARELGIHAIVYQNNAQAIADIQACLAANEAESA